MRLHLYATSGFMSIPEVTGRGRYGHLVDRIKGSLQMASVEQCEAALAVLADRLEEYPHEQRRNGIPERTLELTLLDLDVTFRGRLHDGQLLDITRGRGADKPNVRLTMNSDDLIDLTDRRLTFSHAWATRRLTLDASLRDLLRLRRLM